nr:hypothetical protein [Thermosediminibacter oceani]
MNLKKLALWKKRRGTFPPTVPALHSFFLKIFFAFNKKPLLGYAS